MREKNFNKVQDEYAEWLRHRVKTLNKTALVNYVLKYNGYAAAQDVHVKPTKGVSSGSHGRLYELLIKLALNNYRFNGVASAGQIDTRKKIDGKICKIEIKSGAGELLSWDAYGNLAADVRKADYIIYSPQYTPTATNNCDEAIKNAVLQSFIMPAVEFFDMLEKNGLIRKKRSTASYGEFYFSTMDYDRITIKSFENSAKATDLMYTLLEKNATPLQAWLIEKGIWE